jgi:hypothetical protein
MDVAENSIIRHEPIELFIEFKKKQISYRFAL